MRQHGHPQSGAWCGEFAASVVSAAGLKPPAGAPIASNWRNFGLPADQPAPGYVAVRKWSYRGGGYVRTGDTGSHVTLVQSVDPKAGTFVGFGGNQGRMERQLNAADYEFRRLPIKAGGDQATAVNPTVARAIAPRAAGGANLWIDLVGFPRGVSTSTEMGAGVDSVTVNRGRIGPDVQPTAP
jgi:hypothetical protein